MKRLLASMLFLATAGACSAQFSKWTNKDGRGAELELVAVSGEDGAKVGEFRMRNGRSVKIRQEDLAEADAKRLAEWKPAGAPAAAAGAESVFDNLIDGNLLQLSGKSLRKMKEFSKPNKFYVFYYTASWCGPCQQFTPSLVEFYEKNKNPNFEIVLITSDQDEDAMTDYAVDKKMSWPHLTLRKAGDFKKKFDHGVKGIPALIVCDLEGNNLGNFRSNLAGLADLVK